MEEEEKKLIYKDKEERKVSGNLVPSVDANTFIFRTKTNFPEVLSAPKCRLERTPHRFWDDTTKDRFSINNVLLRRHSNALLL